MARSFTAALGLITLSLAAAVANARDAGTSSRQPAKRAPVEVHDVLDAEAAGLVTVKFIPNDSRSAQVLVTNKSGKPLTLRMPPAYAGVPVLGQMGPGGMGGGMGGMGGMGGGMGGLGGGQAMGGGGMGGMGGMGGGMGGMGGGMGGMGGGMGMPGGAFSVPPEKTKVMRITTVCLEHGKKEPSSRMAYKLVALDTFSTDPKLAALITSLGRGEISQKVAQAATWHVANGLSWEELAAKKIDRLGRPDDAWFSPAELMMAHRSVAVAVERAAATATVDAAAPSASQDPGR